MSVRSCTYVNGRIGVSAVIFAARVAVAACAYGRRQLMSSVAVVLSRCSLTTEPAGLDRWSECVPGEQAGATHQQLLRPALHGDVVIRCSRPM